LYYTHQSVDLREEKNVFMYKTVRAELWCEHRLCDRAR